MVTFISESASAAAAAATATITTPLWPVSSKSTNGTTIAISESEEEKAKKLLYCSLCKVAVNSLSQLEAHNTGESLPEITKCISENLGSVCNVLSVGSFFFS